MGREMVKNRAQRVKMVHKIEVPSGMPGRLRPIERPKRPIRIATLGDWSKYFSYFLAGTQEGAILNGCMFRPIDIRLSWKVIRQNLEEFRPDILFSHMIFSKEPHGPEKHLRELGKLRKQLDMKVFYHLGDARTVPRYPHDISEGVDACLVNQTQLESFERT